MDDNNILVMDIECLPNYFLIMFRKISSGEVMYFEKFEDSELNTKNIVHIMTKYTIVTFNGNGYDIPMAEAATSGFSNAMLYKLSQSIIEENLRGWQARKQFGFRELSVDHVDLIEVCPLKASLKIYAGRLHIKEMMDMPIHHSEYVKAEQLESIRYYCELDLIDTEALYRELKEPISLRAVMSKEYGIDLRSKSDAQIAEAVIKQELEQRFDIRATRQKIEAGTRFRYRPPETLSFESDILKDVFRQYTTLPFTVDASGYTSFNFELAEADRLKSGKNKGNFPDKKPKMKFTIGSTTYTIGIGGIHSNEKSVRHVTDENYLIREYDVAAYYPFIIMNNKLTPRHLGSPFLKIYKDIVSRRLDAKEKAGIYKREGNTEKHTHYNSINESLKITINGSFGKLGSKWSCLYAPDLMMQVTITGQLALLMLIERLEGVGISVISANTDGIVVKIPRAMESVAEDIALEWEINNGYTLEPNDYLSLNSRDINNYIGITERGSKGKGAYANQSEPFYRLRSNPSNEICVTAVKEFLKEGTPVEETILQCKDIRQFVTIRTVNGGAVKGGKTVGKAIRWYYGAEELDAIYYSTNGNKVPRSDGAVPLMKLPNDLPSDIDFDWYITEAKDMLSQLGYK